MRKPVRSELQFMVARRSKDFNDADSIDLIAAGSFSDWTDRNEGVQEHQARHWKGQAQIQYWKWVWDVTLAFCLFLNAFTNGIS